MPPPVPATDIEIFSTNLAIILKVIALLLSSYLTVTQLLGC